MRDDVQEYLEKERELRWQQALAAWVHYHATGLHVTAEEADLWLAKLERGKKAKPPKSHA